MFTSIKSAALIAVLVTTAAAASAATAPTPGLAAFNSNQGNYEKVIALKDGSSLHEYSDGKMALANAYGRAVSAPVGQVVQAIDGSAITISSNEVARLSDELRGHR